jgi:hypothetical protein
MTDLRQQLAWLRSVSREELQLLCMGYRWPLLPNGRLLRGIKINSCCWLSRNKEFWVWDGPRPRIAHQFADVLHYATPMEIRHAFLTAKKAAQEKYAGEYDEIYGGR